tara:strand:- start:945 stop:1193 length:249 start_codon:yes stop_codon:yes gene_type:complete
VGLFCGEKPLKETIVASVVAGLVVYYLTRVAVPAVTQSETPIAQDGAGLLDGLFSEFRGTISDRLDNLLPSSGAETESEVYA